MRVILEVRSGPREGHRVTLAAEQKLHVGRVESADFAFPDDSKMSSAHFYLETDRLGCYVKDAGSTNGTRVNGQLVGGVVLRSGDEILAGQTRFEVYVEGDDVDADASPLIRSAMAPLRSDAQGTFATEKCSSGVTRCFGSVAEVAPTMLADLLAQTHPLYLCVDFNRLDSSLPEDLREPEYLFDWLAPEAAAEMSPVVIAADEINSWSTYVEKGWGGDAVVCVFSQQPKPDLLTHLRQAVRGRTGANGEVQGVLGCCWPSVLSPLCAYGKPDLTARLMQGIDAALVESADEAETWELFGAPEVTKMLMKIGLTPAISDDTRAMNAEEVT